MKKYIDIIGKKVYYIGVERVKTKIIMKWEEDMLEIDRFEKILDELEKKGSAFISGIGQYIEGFSFNNKKRY